MNTLRSASVMAVPVAAVTTPCRHDRDRWVGREDACRGDKPSEGPKSTPVSNRRYICAFRWFDVPV